MKNIHVLPTNKPSRLYSWEDKLVLGTLSTTPFNKNIYITSDEYIGLSYYLDGNLIRKGVVDDKDYWEVRKDYKKIILTTDQDLIKDGVQAIDDDFLEWFVNNPSCEEVEVNFVTKQLVKPYDVYNESVSYYKIIIPKEELKSFSDFSDKFFGSIPKEESKQRLEKYSERFDNKDNEIVEGIFNPETWGKRLVNDVPKQETTFEEEPKQETLEQVAERYYVNELSQLGFINGAKWQEQQTIEEVFEWLTTNNYLTDLKETLIENFKNR